MPNVPTDSGLFSGQMPQPYEKVKDTHLTTFIRKLMAPSMLGSLEAKDFEGLANWYQ
jgi:hypothetical protein